MKIEIKSTSYLLPNNSSECLKNNKLFSEYNNIFNNQNLMIKYNVKFCFIFKGYIVYYKILKNGIK